jgi:hypothetical protein
MAWMPNLLSMVSMLTLLQAFKQEHKLNTGGEDELGPVLKIKCLLVYFEIRKILVQRSRCHTLPNTGENII